MTLSIRSLDVAYGDDLVVSEVELEVSPGEVVCVLGPSGSGKSTLLRAVAGLVPPRGGSIGWANEDLTEMPAHRRGFGLMFQDHALFPHASVGRNVDFGLRMQKSPRNERRERVDRLLGLVGLTGFASRSVNELSGGEQQRVALARALAPDPRLLLLDEPLGALDRGLRDRLVGELRELFDGLGTAVLYVTHDQDEALTVGDRVALMREGRVVQVGAPVDVWRRPADPWVARFLGATNVIATAVVGGVIDFGLGPVPVPMPEGLADVVLRRDALRPDEDGPVGATVLRRRFVGDVLMSRIRVGDLELDISLDVEPVPEVGQSIRMRLDPSRLLVLERAS